MENNNIISIVSQAFYGNKVGTSVRKENIDRFVLGYVSDTIPTMEEKIDRTIINVPNTDNIVIVYNKYREEEDRAYEDKKPTAIIEELGITLYSRCIVCRMNEDGELASLEDGDYEKFEKYLME